MRGAMQEKLRYADAYMHRMMFLKGNPSVAASSRRSMRKPSKSCSRPISVTKMTRLLPFAVCAHGRGSRFTKK